MTEPKIIVGDILESKAQTLVNTVNCVGVMGKGIALAFKNRFPEMFSDYVLRCKDHRMSLGKPYLYQYQGGPWILNFPTKSHWRSISKLSDIEEGLEYLKKHYKEWGITSIAVPPLGCGHGQLEWRIIGPILYRHLSQFDIPVEIYAPFGSAEAQLQGEFLKGGSVAGKVLHSNGSKERVPASWAALAAIVARILDHTYHWPVGRVAFQKIAYFASKLGLPTELEFRRGSYGPFSPQLKRVEASLINNGLLDEEPIGKMIAVKPGPAYARTIKAYQEEIEQWNHIIERVVDLFLRMRGREAEIASTVHFASAELLTAKQRDVDEITIFNGVKEWKLRRQPPLADEEIAGMIRNLNELGIIHAKLSKNLPIHEDF